MQDGGWRGLLSDCHGSLLVMHALGLVMLMTMGALAVDRGRGTLARQLLSNAADAAALAAVSRLPDVEAARAMALEDVEKNIPSCATWNRIRKTG